VGSRPALQITKRCTRLAAASDKAYQLLAHGRWFSPGTPASSTSKTGHIAEILLKVALNNTNHHHHHHHHHQITLLEDKKDWSFAYDVKLCNVSTSLVLRNNTVFLYF
jgi:hypothetical protein